MCPKVQTPRRGAVSSRKTNWSHLLLRLCLASATACLCLRFHGDASCAALMCRVVDRQVSTIARNEVRPTTSEPASHSTSSCAHELRTHSWCGNETSQWGMSVEVQQARNLPPQRHESQTAWISCALAVVSTGCRTAQHLFSTSVVTRRSVQRTDKCPRTANPSGTSTLTLPRRHRVTLTARLQLQPGMECRAVDSVENLMVAL